MLLIRSSNIKSISALPALISNKPALSAVSIKAQNGPTQFIRGKRTKSEASPGTLRAVTQMSVLSASRKQPRVLKLSREDVVRHMTVDTAWKVYQQKLKQSSTELLEAKYNSIVEAANDLKLSNPKLYESSITNVNKTKIKQPARFPIELRVPTDFPPNQIWNYDYSNEVPEKDSK